MNTRITTRVHAIAAAAACLILPATGIAGDDIDRTLKMSSDGLVRVENMAGSIEFTGWDRDEVQVRGEAGNDVEEVEITSNSSGVQIRVRNPKGENRVDGTNLYLRLPKTASIEAESVSADISASRSSGESVILTTVSGDLVADVSPQRLELTSVSGDIEQEGSASRATVETVSGDITLVGPSGEISVSTVSGDVSMEGGEVERGRFESVSGELVLSMALVDGGRVNCDSMSGDVSLRLPESQQADFGAQSFSGDIHTDFGEAVSVSRGPGTYLEHRSGDNGATIRIESFSGDISIRSVD